jgi:hypothetical protein
LFGRDHHVLMGKFVSEAFKEVHQKEWKNSKTPTNNDIIGILTANYATEPRWNKAIEHLRDAGTLTGELKDIGPLMAEVPMDVLKECEDEIKEKLFKWAWPQLRRTLIRGIPEWYKQKLMDKQFEGIGGAGATSNESGVTTPDEAHTAANTVQNCNGIRQSASDQPEVAQDGDTATLADQSGPQALIPGTGH